MDEFNKIIAPFGGNTLQQFGLLLDRITNSNLDIDGFRILLSNKEAEQLQEAEARQQSFLSKKKKLLSNVKKARPGRCPECDSPLIKVPINTGRRDQVDGDYNWMIDCTNDVSCTYHKLIKE